MVAHIHDDPAHELRRYSLAFILKSTQLCMYVGAVCHSCKRVALQMGYVGVKEVTMLYLVCMHVCMPNGTLRPPILLLECAIASCRNNRPDE